jgi:hypothetical protein
MDLYIHYGIYKTGSSFLQTNCARNREILEASGYLFPKSPKDDEMLAGRITPGNGNGITNYLKAGNFQRVAALLGKWVEAALQKGCNKILISDEALIHAFSIQGAIHSFSDLVRKAGIESVYCLAFFRDPEDHCLSTFKHRAKKGTIRSFTEWLDNGYETMDVIEQFISQFKSTDFHWVFKKYKRNGNEMADFFFKDWLNINTTLKYSGSEVNPSLSLSELYKLHYYGQINNNYVKYIYHNLLLLPRELKAEDKELEEMHRIIARSKLIKRKKVLIELNNLLAEDEQLVLKNPINTPIELNENMALNLSSAQFDCIERSIVQANLFSSRISDFIRNVYRNLLVKIR